jgi:ABC-type transporter MlaC component
MQKMLYVISFICLCIFPVVGEDTCETSKNGEKEASAFIKNLVDEALAIVNQGNASDDIKRQQLSKCINKYLDVERITEKVFSQLGYNELEKTDKEKVKEYLKKYLLTFYAGEGKLSAMVNAELSGRLVAEPEGKKEEGKPQDFSVITNFKKDTSSVEIIWITNGEKVFYVKIAGFNQIITLRAEMKEAVGSGTLMDYINKH